MVRRVTLVVGLLLAAYLTSGGAVSAETLTNTPLQPRSRTPVVPAPPPPRPRVVASGTLVATVRPGRVVLLRSSPTGPVVARLSARTRFGSPRTFAVTAVHDGLQVITTELPNGRPGWIEGSQALRLARTTVSLDADLSAQVLHITRAGRVIRTLRIGIGAPGTRTPTGRFAVTDKLQGAQYSAAYGCCILALSGHQTNLPSGWTGGDRLAVHGGPTTGAVTTGCLHAREEDLRYLMRVVPLGAQIVIHP
jgi:lipoprotein-anchoring transpeptidase ErfK/SrfK